MLNWKVVTKSLPQRTGSCSLTAISITQDIFRASSGTDSVAPCLPHRPRPIWQRSCFRTQAISRRRRPRITTGAAPQSIAPAPPLYTAEQGLAAAERVKGVTYQTRLSLVGGLVVSFARAGHILGSAMVTVEVGAGAGLRRVVFSGDLGRCGAPILHGLSAHADAGGLMRWLGTAKRPPRRVFVVHGDPGPARALATRIEKELGWAVSVPAYRDRIPIE